MMSEAGGESSGMLYGDGAAQRKQELVAPSFDLVVRGWSGWSGSMLSCHPSNRRGMTRNEAQKWCKAYEGYSFVPHGDPPDSVYRVMAGAPPSLACPGKHSYPDALQRVEASSPDYCMYRIERVQEEEETPAPEHAVSEETGHPMPAPEYVDYDCNQCSDGPCCESCYCSGDSACPDATIPSSVDLDKAGAFFYRDKQFGDGLKAYRYDDGSVSFYLNGEGMALEPRTVKRLRRYLKRGNS